MHGDERLGRRGVSITTAFCLVFCLAVLALHPTVSGCGGTENGDGSEPGDGTAEVLTVEEALASRPGENIKVTGAIVGTGSRADRETVLASVLLESYPPQAGGTVLPVSGLDLGALVGLNSTEGQPELAPVTWSDYWVVLEGTLEDGVLQVNKTPPVVQTASGDILVRFSPVSTPLKTGTTVWWAFEVRNDGAEPVGLTFTNGQRGDVVLRQDGVEKYRWSQGKVFTEAIETVTVAPGRALPVVMNDTFEAAIGDYELTATVTAGAGPDGTGQVLPGMSMTVTVH